MGATTTELRSDPPWTHSRCYGLRRLREAIDDAVSRHVRPRLAQRAAPTVIDLGCGASPYRRMFEDIGCTYLGADLPGNHDADLTIDPVTGHVRQTSGGGGAVIVSTQVLEHTPSPGDYLDEARRLCEPGGLLVLSTHGMFKHHPQPRDLWRWTGDGLQKLLSEHGWRVLELRGVLGFAAAAWGLLQDAVVMKLPRIAPLRRGTAVLMQQGVGLLDLLYTDQQRRENAAVYLVVAENTEPCAS